VWSPLAGGFLTGKYHRGEPLPVGSRLSQRTPAESAPLTDPQKAYDTIDEMSRIATERGVTIAQVALTGYCVNRSYVTGHRRDKTAATGR
jgi:aryl-alcohol dehydrogenase-like predicted oxidoreductase